MRTFIIIGTILAISGVVILFTPIWHNIRGAFMEERAYTAERLFQGYGDEVFRLAQKIEWGDEITSRDIAPIQDRINDRFGDKITFLFQALGSANIPAIDALIGAGADMTMIDKPSEGSTRDFVYFLGLPGGDLLDQDGMNQLIRIYLKHDGDPNYRMQDSVQKPLITRVAINENIDGVRILLKAGADPWANAVHDNGAEDNMMMRVNASYNQFTFLDELIDKGFFTKVSQRRLSGFLHDLSSYAQRGDQISQEIQRIAMRVLKRNPHYIEESKQLGAARIFKNHWQDPYPGVIPWDVINSDAVQ